MSGHFQNFVELSIYEFIWVHLFHSIRPWIDATHFVILFFHFAFFLFMKRLYYSISLTQICLLKWPKIYFWDYFWSIIFVFQSRPFRNWWCWWQTPPFEVFTRYNLFASVFPHTVLMWCSLYWTDCVLVLISVLLLF